MDKHTKIILALAATALIATGCSSTNSNPFAQQATNNNAKGTTHTHNGVAHTHPLPAGGLSHSHNFNVATGTASGNTCRPCGTTNNNVVTTPQNTGNTGGNCHMHNGRQHCHPLPATGTSHTHNQGTQTTNANSGSYYDNNANTNTSYYNPAPTQKGAVNHDHSGKMHSHVLPASGLNHTHNQGSTSFGNTYGGGSSNTNNSGGNTYTVQRGDTVFQVMRNTGVYWKDIIRLNNLQAPNYQITPGQTLRLR